MSNKSNKPTAKKQKAPPELTTDEDNKLCECFYLQGWEFDNVIAPHCAKIGSYYIGYDDRPEKKDYIYATVYGLLGMNKDTGDRFCACVFLRLEAKLYQFFNLEDTAALVELLRKEFEWNLYQEKQEKEIHAEVTGKE